MKKIISIFLISINLFTFSSCYNEKNTTNTKHIETKDSSSSNIKVETSDLSKLPYKNVGKIIESTPIENNTGVKIKVSLVRGTSSRGDKLYYIAPGQKSASLFKVEGIMKNDTILNSVKAQGKFDYLIFNVNPSIFKVGGIIYTEK